VQATRSFTRVGPSGQAVVMTLALLAALALGGAGGYVAGTAAQGRILPTVTTGTSQVVPASRWSHEERATYGLAQFGPASRWSHEELPDYLK
jgi:hypothetical protein